MKGKLRSNPLEATAIWPTLWIGGHPPFQLEELTPWDVIVFAAVEYQPHFDDEKRLFIMIPLDDAPLNDAAKLAARKVGDQVAAYVKNGARCLMTCSEGWNRSALICALAMLALDVPVAQAIGEIKMARKGTLTNRSFVSFLRSL